MWQPGNVNVNVAVCQAIKYLAVLGFTNFGNHSQEIECFAGDLKTLYARLKFRWNNESFILSNMSWVRTMDNGKFEVFDIRFEQDFNLNSSLSSPI